MAIKEQDKVFYEEAENGDKIINLPITRANNVEGLGRSINTTYSVGNVVYTDTNLSVALKCVTAGTTSSDELDISTASVGSTVEDGSVAWEVVSRDLSADLKVVEERLPRIISAGFIQAYGGNSVPDGWLACDGSVVSRTTYADLYAAIGTTYGSGNGSTTFNLPNLNNGSFLEGSNTAGTVKSAGLPNITGQLTGNVMSNLNNAGNILMFKTATGAFAINGSSEKATNIAYNASEEDAQQYINFSAENSSAIYGNSTTVQPKAVTVKFCIKY